MYLDVFVSCLRGTKFTTFIGSTSPQMRRTPKRGDTRRHDDGYLDQDNVKKKRKKETWSISVYCVLGFVWLPFKWLPYFQVKNKPHRHFLVIALCLDLDTPFAFAVAIMKRVCAQVNQAQ